MVKTVVLCFFGYRAMQRWWGGGELAVGKMRRGPSPYFPRHLTKEGTLSESYYNMPCLTKDTLILRFSYPSNYHVEIPSDSFRHCLCPSVVLFSAYLFVSGVHQDVLLLISHIKPLNMQLEGSV
jgi:hypothetical protein